MSGLASPLQARILAQLQARIGTDAKVGLRLNEAELAEWLGVSRTPVRQVLRNLERAGYLGFEHRRGFQVLRPFGPVEAPSQGEAHLDERVMRDMALGRLVRATSERALMKRYGVGRGVLVSTLRRLMRDQLVEPSPGRGWIFADVGSEALRESYRFRQIVEPATILIDDFRVETAALEALDRAHAAALDDLAAMDRAAPFELDARFHLAIAAGGGTRFLAEAIARQNNIRRVAEYIGFVRLDRIRHSMAEHRGILAALRDGRRKVAASLMRLHLHISEHETFAHLDEDLRRISASSPPAGGAQEIDGSA